MKLLPIIKKYLPYVLLIMIVLFNFYLYKSEFKVLSDPNDNTFHFALIDDAKTVWNQVFSGKLSPLYLLDSWNERWAEGFSLSSYYSHLPEAAISLLSYFVPISAYKLFVILRTSILILLPVSFFFGAKILGFSSVYGLVFSFFSQAMFTDGLYGLDSPSFLWRGWGLSTQLMAVFFLPLAFAYGINYLKNKKNLGLAITFNFLLAQSHLGMFYLLLFAYPVFWIFAILPEDSFDLESKKSWKLIFDKSFEAGKRLLIFLSITMISLAYFIFPFFTTSKYRNFSLWDPIWKFDSWGLNQIIIWLANGELFDFNRFPFITIFIIGGVFWGLISRNKLIWYFIATFFLYSVLFVGRDILGPMINIIPGLGEYHIHRVIVMVQFFGLLIASGLINDLLLLSKKFINSRINNNETVYSLLVVFLIILSSYSVYLMEKPIINYAKDNSIWIERSNIDYQNNIGDYRVIADTLKKMPPARVYAGRPGNWGRNFKIGDTQIYMALSQDGFPIIGFLPQSWSPNSDSEQFFNEESSSHFDLYNVGYLVLPSEKKPPNFAKLIIKKGRFSLYEYKSEGWFTLGKSSLEVISKKTDLVNVTHLWYYSNMFINKDYPMIGLNNEKIPLVNRTIKMSGLNNYDGKNIFRENPFAAQLEKFEPTISNKVEKIIPQGYQVSFRLENQCSNCILILKQTFHPNWKVSVNGKNIKALTVFPFFIGIPLDKSGDYKIEAVYQQSILKTSLLIFSLIFFIFIYQKIKKWF